MVALLISIKYGPLDRIMLMAPEVMGEHVFVVAWVGCGRLGS